MKQDIIIVSTNDWHGFWFQRQEFATRFAALGHRVFYINRIPQRIPKPGRVIRWLLSNRQGKKIINKIPDGVRVFSPRLLPPFRWLRPVNRQIWKKLWNSMPQEEHPKAPVLITYQPTYNVQDLGTLVGASRIVYINTHVYDADPSVPRDLLISESQLVKRADVLMADSSYNSERLKRYAPEKEVYRAMPGVALKRFSGAYRGNEVDIRKTILFFGDIGRYLDLPLYNQLAESYKVIFIGIVDKSIGANISEKITVLPPVAPQELPGVLHQADILSIFYKGSDYVKGILPAKFFECLATGKPLFVSGLPETRIYMEGIYYIEGGFEEASSKIEKLDELETADRKAFRRKIAEEADWENRFSQFSKRIFT